MAVLNNNALVGASGKAGPTAGRSVRFNSADGSTLTRTPASAGNRRTFTLSFWFKPALATAGEHYLFYAWNGGSAELDYWDLRYNTSRALYIGNYNGAWRATTAVFRDPAAWYHIVVAWDTTQSTASNRIRLYVNGSEVTAFSTSSDPALNAQGQVNAASSHVIGSGISGYLALIHLIDGQALTPSSFGETSATTGRWEAKTYAGTYSGNSFFLDFSDNSAATSTTLGKDSSGLGNNWTPNNLSVTAGSGNDSLRDHPVSAGTSTGAGGEVSGNYATWNPLSSRNTTLTNGNLDASIAFAVSNDYFTDGTIAVTSGKWYWEYTYNSGNQAIYLGAVRGNNPTNLAYYDNGVHYYGGNGRSYTDSGSGVTYGATYTTGDVIGVALDITNSQITFYKNGSSQGTLTLPSSTSGWKCSAANGSSSTAQGVTLNAGQRPFAYTAPSGFKALCDTNLPAPVIAKPDQVMGVKLYTGNGSTQTISGLEFSPDLVWLKARSVAYSHQLYDPIRGTTNALISNTTAAEAVYSGGLTAFNSDGFTIGNDGGINQSSSTFVAWCWDAGTTTVTNNVGSITSQVRTNGYLSIVTYTGTGVNATIGHGGLVNLDKGMIIVKNRSLARNWFVGHGALGWNKVMEGLNTTAAAYTNLEWNNTAPSSTVFTVANSTDGNLNLSGSNYVAYCFAPVAGYSSFGSYVGNGTTNDGTFVYLGFRPKFVMVKNASSTGDWNIWDSVRDTDNVIDLRLRPSTSESESSLTNAFNNVDFLSNGFKLRGSAGLDSNSSGATYIYAAFAENPFQYARAR